MARLRRTTIGLRETTKNKLDAHRAPGQCYDGFLCQLVDLWEKNHAAEDFSRIDYAGRKTREDSSPHKAG